MAPYQMERMTREAIDKRTFERERLIQHFSISLQQSCKHTEVITLTGIMTPYVSTGESKKQFSIATGTRRENKEYIILIIYYKPLNPMVLGDIPRRLLAYQRSQRIDGINFLKSRSLLIADIQFGKDTPLLTS